MLDQINLQTLHLFNSSYLRYVKSPRIYAAHSTQTSYFTPNTLCKAHNSMPLHAYTVNFATSSNLQEILLAYRLHSYAPPFAHLFVLIIFEPISHVYTTQTSYFIPKTF